MRVLLAQINSTVGDIQGNLQKILQNIQLAKSKGYDLVLFPEMALCGYPADDFLLLPHFIQALDKPLQTILEASKGLSVVVGMPRYSDKGCEKPLYNSAAVFDDGRLLGYQDKVLLPIYDVFDESRYFQPGGAIKLWELKGKKVAITICEDIWQHSGLLSFTHYARDPVLEIAKLKPELMLNLSASPYHYGKVNLRTQVISRAAQTLHCPVMLCNQVGGNDGLVFDGHSSVINEHGAVVAIAKGFCEDTLWIDTKHLEKPISLEPETIESLNQALVLGVKDYFNKSQFKTALIGLSGGIDSAVVLCVAVEALGAKNVRAISMPSQYTTPESKRDAALIAQHLGVELIEVPIDELFKKFLDTLTPHFIGKPADVTEENLQARIRGTILMAFSNKFGSIVLSTGNKSEMAVGYTTLYGDTCGGLAVISDVTKGQVYELAEWYNRKKEVIPQYVIDRAPSAELRPDQKDSDSLPEYSMLDTVVREYVVQHTSPEEIAKKHNYPIKRVQNLVYLIHRNEYKRRQTAPGLRVTERAFSIGRRFPIVQQWSI